ncbi:MAG TPA: hypothetical protein VGN57_15945 [Pirellulaceae bacterium]|jgi:lipoprotein NlpI|nr:hypothetical protein [Pirellulaceae bacterium]
MNPLTWLKGIFSSRQKSLGIYRSAMAKSKKKDYAGAIEDYDVVAAAKDVPDDVRAMAVYNRSLAYDALGKHAEAAKDLDKMLSMPHVPERVKNEATLRRERLRKRGER